MNPKDEAPKSDEVDDVELDEAKGGAKTHAALAADEGTDGPGTPLVAEEDK